MLQLERLNVVEKTLEQITNEMRNGQFDEDIREVFKASIRCGIEAGRISESINRKLDAESEEETNEDS